MSLPGKSLLCPGGHSPVICSRLQLWLGSSKPINVLLRIIMFTVRRACGGTLSSESPPVLPDQMCPIHALASHGGFGGTGVGPAEPGDG